MADHKKLKNDYDTLKEKYDSLHEKVRELLLLCSKGCFCHAEAMSVLPFYCDDVEDEPRKEMIKKFVETSSDKKLAKIIDAMVLTLHGDRHAIVKFGDFFAEMLENDYDTFKEKYDSLCEKVPELLLLCSKGYSCHAEAMLALPFYCDEDEDDELRKEMIKKFVEQTSSDKKLLVKVIDAMVSTLDGDRHAIVEFGNFFAEML